MDHDQRFKTLIRQFFAQFLLLFFRDWAARLDLSQLQWADTEVYPDPPEGSRHVLDLLAKVPLAAGADTAVRATLLLVHIEIESPDRTTRLTPRLLSEQERFLLGECVQAYLPLDEDQRRQFETLLHTESYAAVRAMNQTIYEKGIEEGIEKGIEKGRLEGQTEIVCALIEARFGSLPETVRRELEQMPAEQVRRLALKISVADSLADLGLTG